MYLEINNIAKYNVDFRNHNQIYISTYNISIYMPMLTVLHYIVAIV